VQRLLAIGFQRVGYWSLNKDKVVFKIDALINASNVLYAFVNDDIVLYIGKTTQTLSKRMQGYQYPGPTQTTNIRNNANIKDLLTRTNSLDIYALPDTGLLHYGDFQINLAAGLEDSLIQTLMPAWNTRL